jgi:signal transduction histidine kinase
MIDPTHLEHNELPPPVTLRSLSADGRIYPIGGDLILPKATRAVTFDYTALSLTLSERNRFRYQLVGFDTGWQDAGTRRQAFYTNLTPGSYTFKVIAANNDGVWNETGTSVIFTVPPTFFQTIWFKILVIVAAGCVLWGFFALRLRQATADVSTRLGERLRERERIARELHDTLLQGFQMLVLRFQVITDTLSPESPVRGLMEDSLSRAEQTLQEGREKVTALRSESESGNELAVELARFGRERNAGSQTTFQLTMEGNSRKIRSVLHEDILMIAREAIVNSSRHANATTIECVIQFAPRYFLFVCTDNGCGIPEEVLENRGKQGHWGLVGMEERARNIGGVLRISRGEAGGTQVELKLRATIAYAVNGRFNLFRLLRNGRA